ncbi:PiggyBac transposable element-derived protein 4-like [Plakobranchus ocellatus]|uniref:PiggyBac transposable element-derived protein 4-like n=1 Tax=Plakobranchus ocellatus TaxID=259542 RepID=A0AAV4BGG7_9GAST|nr:PiggyBac transposable element-derived protein 4-like [Plakobranchus ocellatus]
MNTIFAKIRGPPKEFYLSETEWQRLETEADENNQKQQLESMAKKLPIQNRTIAGFPRYCEKCKTIKPDRCHHCSVCSSLELISNDMPHILSNLRSDDGAEQ